MARCFLSIGAILLVSALPSQSDDASNNPRGHLQKLGAHKDPQGITMNGKFSDPTVFYVHFVRPGKPILMRGVLTDVDHPGLTQWTDEYFKNLYGDKVVKVETSKKERRGKGPTWLPFQQFLSRYLSEDLYMVHSLDRVMEDLALVPPSLQCGGIHKLFQEAVLWMGSGATRSVLHYDDLDNFLCLLDGHKRFVLIDKVYKEDVESHGFNQDGGYSTVDVDSVDMKLFPNFQNIPWHEVSLNKGDCVFIPRGWYHQVTSSNWRHVAVNIWFSHPYWFNTTDCPEKKSPFKLLEPISTFGFASPNEVYRTKLLDILHDKGLMAKPVFMSALDTITEERKEKFFAAIDKYKDTALSWSELYGFDIDRAILKFPDIFGLPGNPVGDESEEVILYTEIEEIADAESMDEEGESEGVEEEVPDAPVERSSPTRNDLHESIDEPDSFTNEDSVFDEGAPSKPLPDDPVLHLKSTDEDSSVVNDINDNDIEDGDDDVISDDAARLQSEQMRAENVENSEYTQTSKRDEL
ncbi:uncharacterized protein LOC101845590 [Aplysia californica]|uniref:Uncharacterized protein LOC101845590 n=1 Tax=Aplysia californica TaxID=6500 RepID=A0ABM1AD51_APLCA|nr:uncharacterized protein LOC101845590 [Aplysia californica]